MATLEDFHMVVQTTQNMEGLRQDIRANAESYKARLVRGEELAVVATIADEDAGEYLRRLQWQRDIFDAPTRLTRLTTGFSALGIDEAEVRVEWQELQDASTFQQGARKTTAGELNQTADEVLSRVVSHDRVFF